MVSGNYPPGTSTRDLKRAGIIDDRTECPDCGELIGEGDSHSEDCPQYGQTKTDIEEAEEARHQEQKMEQRRLEEARERAEGGDTRG
jgi:hypothetical protein